MMTTNTDTRRPDDPGQAQVPRRTRMYLVGQGSNRITRAAGKSGQQALPLTWGESQVATRTRSPEELRGPAADSGPAGPQAAIGPISLMICDVLAGKRAVRQLNRLATSDCLRKLQRRARTWRNIGSGKAPLAQCGLQSVRWQATSSDTIEATLITRVGPRYRAIAVQLVFRWNRWVVHAIETG